MSIELAPHTKRHNINDVDADGKSSNSTQNTPLSAPKPTPAAPQASAPTHPAAELQRHAAFAAELVDAFTEWYPMQPLLMHTGKGVAARAP